MVTKISRGNNEKIRVSITYTYNLTTVGAQGGWLAQLVVASDSKSEGYEFEPHTGHLFLLQWPSSPPHARHGIPEREP